MDRLRFWKKSVPVESEQANPATVTRFGVQPRTDVGSAGLPADPAEAARVQRLRRRREQLQNEVQAALDASNETNRWRSEIALIDQAIAEISTDLDIVPVRNGPTGFAVEPVPIALTGFDEQPVIRLTFRIGLEAFLLAEDLDWAERGFQLARSDLHIENGDFANLVSDPALVKHLQGSLLVYGTDVRERLIEGMDVPAASLADLARPSDEFGGWLDWAGHSSFAQERELRMQGMRAEITRLENERATLIAEEARTAESLPFAQRRLAEVDAELASLTG